MEKKIANIAKSLMFDDSVLTTKSEINDKSQARVGEAPNVEGELLICRLGFEGKICVSFCVFRFSSVLCNFRFGEHFILLSILRGRSVGSQKASKYNFDRLKFTPIREVCAV